MSEKSHILIIDDEKNYLLILQTLLEEEGCCFVCPRLLEEGVEMPCHRSCVVTPEYSC